MPTTAAGIKLGRRELLSKLESLDIDEGVRIESCRGGGGKKKKLFVNRRPSGTFVMQHGDSDDFDYFDNVGQVVDRLGREMKSYAAYAY